MCTKYYAREIPTASRSELLYSGEWAGKAAIVSHEADSWQKELVDIADNLCNQLYCLYESGMPFNKELDGLLQEEFSEYKRELVCEDYYEAFGLAEELYKHSGINSPDCLCKALSFLTGAEWDNREIHGYVQGEWAILFYTPEVREDIPTIESAYFGMFRTIMVHDSFVYTDLSGPLEVNGYVFESFEYDDKKVKDEIRDIVGADETDEIIFWKFDGFVHLPNYVAV